MLRTEEQPRAKQPTTLSGREMQACGVAGVWTVALCRDASLKSGEIRPLGVRGSLQIGDRDDTTPSIVWIQLVLQPRDARCALGVLLWLMRTRHLAEPPLAAGTATTTTTTTTDTVRIPTPT